MSGFLSKSKQRLEHTNKLNVGEFKTLGGLLGQEKSLLNSHIRVASDLRKASHALDEWAQSEGPDLAVSVVVQLALSCAACPVRNPANLLLTFHDVGRCCC
jgi:hypothetical protein